MRNEIAFCLDRASKDAAVRATIITGDPAGNAFCVGADLSPAGPDNPGGIEGDVPLGRKPDSAFWRDGGGIAGLVRERLSRVPPLRFTQAPVCTGKTHPRSPGLHCCWR
jgi:hypothetical protein